MHDLNDIEGHQPCQIRLSLRKPDKLSLDHLHRLSLLASDVWIYQIQAEPTQPQPLVHNHILPMQPHSLISEGTAISGFLAYVRRSIHWVNTARACWEHRGVVSRFNAGQMCFTGEFISLRPARRRSEAFLMLFLFKVQRG